MRGINLSASSPEIDASMTGTFPYQRPSAGQLFCRTGFPHPTTSKRVQRDSFVRLSTIQLCTEKTPFHAPAVPVKMTIRAGSKSLAAGSIPVLDQLASRHERGSLPIA